MKRLIVLCVIFVLVISTVGCNQSERKPSYIDFINELKIHQNGISYSIKDIDGNGTEDLIVLNNTSLSVYTYKNKILSVGEHKFLTGTVRFFYSDKLDFPGIFYFTASGGINHYGYMTITNDEFCVEELWTEDYSGISESKNKITEISKDKDLIKESKRQYEAGNDISFVKTNIDKVADMESVYNSFLSNKLSATDKQGQLLNIKDFTNDNTFQYAFYDMNGDEIPELLIKSAQNLSIFWIKDNELALWHQDTSYTFPLNNGSLLSKREGAAPEHIDYSYTILKYDGSEKYKLFFSEYPASNTEKEQNDHKYFINDNEVTKSAYGALTSELLNLNGNKIHWNSYR